MTYKEFIVKLKEKDYKVKDINNKMIKDSKWYNFVIYDEYEILFNVAIIEEQGDIRVHSLQTCGDSFFNKVAYLVNDIMAILRGE